MSNFIIERNDSLQHFGIKGQKWGVRRYENEDGTLTDAGKKRYAKAEKTASKEKYTKEEIIKRAKKGAAIGAVAGSSVGQMVDRYAKKKMFNETTHTNPFKVKKYEDVEKNNFDDLGGFTWKDMKNGVLGSMKTGFHTNILGYRVDNYSYYFPETKFKSNGDAYHFYQKMTKNLMLAPAIGAVAGAGVGALGSVAVSKIHNLRIDKAKNFIEQYQEAYKKTMSGGNHNA